MFKERIDEIAEESLSMCRTATQMAVLHPTAGHVCDVRCVVMLRYEEWLERSLCKSLHRDRIQIVHVLAHYRGSRRLSLITSLRFGKCRCFL